MQARTGLSTVQKEAENTARLACEPLSLQRVRDLQDSRAKDRNEVERQSQKVVGDTAINHYVRRLYRLDKPMDAYAPGENF